MRKHLFAIICLCCVSSLSAQNSSYTAYVEQYKDIAIRQMQSASIPASIIMAQALLESGAGSSYLARTANNHFGIKCTSDWTGASVKKDDDRKNECFRSYAHPEESFRDHSAFLKRDRYAFLYSLPVTDYKAWASGLKAAGYATDPTYAEKLTRIIETYRLYELDSMALVQGGVQPAPETPTSAGGVATSTAIYDSSVILFHKNKSLPYVQAGKGEGMEDIARKHRKSVSSLLLYNDMNYDDTLREGDTVFLSSKRTKGADKYYTVQEGDTMFSIAQRVGMTLQSLYEKNRLKVGAMPPVGTRLYLQRNMPRREATSHYHVK